MTKTIRQILIIAAVAGACGTGYNLWNKKSPRYLDWVMDERLRGMDLLTGAPSPPPSKAPPVAPQPGPAPGVSKAVTPAPGTGSEPPTKAAPTPPTSPVEAPPAAPADGKPAPAPTPQPQSPAAAPAPGDPARIEHDLAHEEYKSDTLFIDARRTREYEAGHVTGALSMSAWEADLLEKITRLRDDHPAEAPIVIYCGSSKDCEDSKIVARQLKEVGFTSLMVYTGGFPEWEKQKPALVTKGKEPGTREAP